MLGTSGMAMQYPAKSQIQNIFHMHLLAIINLFLSKMQQERNANGEDIVIEMTLKKFRSIHEPKPGSVQTNEVSRLNLPPLPSLDLTSASTAPPTLPHTASASRSRERRSNTVLSQVQGAFKVKPEEMMSGGISRAKFKCLIDNHLKKQKDFEVISNLILDEVFKNKSLISWDELDAAISRHHLDKVALIEPPAEPSRGTWLWAKVQFKNFFKFFWDDHGYLFWSLVLFSGLILRFAIAFIEYSSKSGVWVGIARGCGANLNILMMLLPLTMAKSTHTRLREIPFILKYFPIDDMIEIHINISKLAAAFTVGHIISHIINASGSVDGGHLPSSRAGITGIVGTIVFIFILLSFRFKNTHFNLFAVGHIVGAPLLVIMCVMHANSVSWWMLPTVFLYCCDKGFVTNEKFMFPIRKVQVLPGNAVLIKFDCVPLLQFTPGQYISIRIPSVSQNENHPFSIASAPGDEELQVVIKVVGDWTGELRRQVDNGIVCPGIMVTVFGPYGAPAQNVFKFESVILVCGGIGVTPFASILQFFNSNLQHDGESYDHKNPRHDQTPGRTRSMTYAENVQANYLATLHHLVRTNDVQFIWVCSDLTSLSWFTEVLQDIHLNQQRQICSIRIKIYVTSLPGERLDTMAFHLARRLFFEACGYDAFCGLSEPCCCGRPEWFDVLSEASRRNDIKVKSDSEIGVFFCGPPSMEKDLAVNIEKVNNIGKSKTRFKLLAEKF